MTALTVLGIESSCDETAAAVVRGRADAPPGEILSNVVYDQTDLHSAFGGVVPEIAARAHAEKLDVAVAEALRAANLSLPDMDAIAVTAGPGLIGGLISGVSCAKGLALGAEKPLVGVNHLEGHALTARLTDGIAYPFLLLLVSGGHCQLLSVEGPDTYRRLGTTLVKLDTLRAAGPVSEQDQADLCAGFQAACVEALTRVTGKAMAVFREAHPDVAAPVLAVAGGVAANQSVRSGLDAIAAVQGFTLVAPPLSLCTDNAAMIAWAGLERFAGGHRDDLSLAPRPRWPLDATSKPVANYGKRGAKS